MLTVEEARSRVLDAVRPLTPVELPLERAIGLAAAADVISNEPLPRFDNSSMDGYAVRAADVAAAAERPVELRLLGEVRAGVPGSSDVGPGAAVRIMTGGAVPAGADAVVPVEQTEEAGETVVVREPVAPGAFIRRAGEDVLPGAVAVPAGCDIASGEAALLAALGVDPVLVHPSPLVAVLVTGDELVDVRAEVTPGRVRDSNSIALRALVAEAGATPVSVSRVPDDYDATLRAFARAAGEADLIVSSGGVAVGRYDLVKKVVEELGSIDFWKVAMQPGKPVVLGEVKGTPFLGLPGNPVSVHVSFEQFVRPALLKMRGRRGVLRPRFRARLGSPVTKPALRQHFVRVRLEPDAGGWTAHPTGPQGSHISSSLVACHGVAIAPAGVERIERGSEVIVEVWRLPHG
ncbi:MAG: molybdopterin molybdotransferase MoeA [Actinomycetota bacterium]|nr:molybdopterin molybdotransferase MoeA [Actinomycetota bacterium]